MTRRALGLGGAALFVLSSALVRGGLFDHHRYGDVALYGHYAHEMTGGNWPYRDFFDEYPVLAQPLFFFVRVLPGPFVTSFKWTMAACGVAAILLMVAAYRGSNTRLAAAVLVAGFAPLLVGPVFLDTYDLFPAALTVGAVAALVAGRERTAYVLLALAIAAKIYPIVLAPIVLWEAWERGALRRAVTWVVGVLVLVHLPFAVMGPGGLRFSYWLQLKRNLEVESLGGGVLLVLDRLGLYTATLKDEAPGSRDVVGTLPNAVGVVSTLLVVAAVALVTVLYVRGRRDRLLAAAAAVTAFVAFNKVLSPQYLTWLVPLVPPAGFVEAAVVAASLGLTRLEWDRFIRPHGSVEHWGQVLSWWILARDLVLVSLFALLAFRLRAGSRSRTVR
jgi:glycosyl transferase family 87